MSVERLNAEARDGLSALWQRLRAGGCGAPPECQGQLIRPVVALAGAAALGAARDEALWAAVAAVQLAHEASLLHDDVIDNAALRRNEPTLATRSGVAAALVEGDHLLTTAYRLAAATGSAAFVSAFAYAVERTVAGEKLQGRSAGLVLDERAYRNIVGSKSGELLACALASAPLLAGAPCAGEWYALGRRLGTLYQMLDDLLDYCPEADTGKPALGDYQHGRWTWPLQELGDVGFGREPVDVARLLAAPDAHGSVPLQRALARFQREADEVLAALALHLPDDEVIGAMVTNWTQRAAQVVERAAGASVDAWLRDTVAARFNGRYDLREFFRVNSRSFSFAATLFPPGFREHVSAIYAFCRFTDDLADSDDGTRTEDRLLRLDRWLALSRQAFDGSATGIRLLDDVMPRAAAAGVPFEYVEELVEGMRMDVRNDRYRTLQDLRVYSYRVAGVVGQWLTRTCGIHDPATLERAAALGHAMQLTNILRDVGEDLRRERLYLPGELLMEHGIDEAQLGAAARGTVDAGAQPLARDAYARMLERLMTHADRDYELALEATPRLPAYFRRAVVVAAHVYRGIHAEVRSNGYDNLTRRAHTSTATKVRLAARALLPGGLAEAVGNGRSPRRALTTALLLTGLLAAPGHAQRSASAGEPQTPAAHAHTLQKRLQHAPAFDAAIALDLTRALYFVAVDSSSAVQRGHALVGELRRHAPGFAEQHDLLILAYEGAFNMLEAKHGRWPHQRVRAVRAGLSRLDAAVAGAPSSVEVRYLRLVSTHYLPGFFGRRDSARDDLRALTELLSGTGAELPPSLHGVISRFVAEVG